MLLSIDQIGKNDQHQLPRLQDIFCRHARKRGQTRDDHWWWPKCKAVPMGFRGLGVCICSGENECGDIESIGEHLISSDMCDSKMLESWL